MSSDDYFGPKNRYVKELAKKDFDSVAPWKLKSDSASGLVLFYAPRCPYCKDVAPIFEKAAKNVGFCDFFAFNCEKYKNHVMKIKEDMPGLIQGYPSIIIYKNGLPEEYYSGERTPEAFLSVCMKNCANCKK